MSSHVGAQHGRWQFFAVPYRPELNQSNKIDFVAANTDPRVSNFQLDTSHMYAKPRCASVG